MGLHGQLKFAEDAVLWTGTKPFTLGSLVVYIPSLDTNDNHLDIKLF